ncbi:adenylate/guanylate cyclase domain-containing protein [Microvirga yunnanensis]|uniref:adenylate/guanylate cyclase domain-containing protein n=1 Tax=Microvirga yunnanensis TaxID=2953740 RepID=UPI0021C7686D|nr:adenylate/guanylate cyclase domain-containing protein [Microvirga sp. HBU65207]
MERRLAALFAADVEGYSRLMEEDEAATFETLASHRAILDGFIAEHRGRIANTAGDSVLAEFPSAVDAVTCALRAQEALASGNAKLPETRRLQFRVGVHVGDVMVKGGDLFGDGVNIAARLQALSRPGGICLSATAQEYVRKALPVIFEDLGPQRVKNIDEPVRAFAVKATQGQGVPARTPSARELLRADRPAVAVLPFTNMGDPDQAYFSDGITEDIITELARFRELLVIARNSSFLFRGKDVDVREVGRVLNADYVVEGSVRRAGDRVRITAQLINAATGSHLWADRYDRSFEDVFVIQDEIARGVVATVARRIEEETEAVARRRPPQDMRAYDLFLQGHRLSDVFTEDGQARARAFFERARDLDPTFARAYTGLAFNSLNRAADEGVGLPRERDPNRIEAHRLVEQALTVDPTEPRVQSTAGYVFLTWREFDRAERHLGLAQSMNPNDATIQIFWAWAQACLGNPAKGLTAAELARRLNPRHPHWYSFYETRALFLLRRYEDVVAQLHYRITGEPTQHRRDMLLLSAAFGLLGQAEPAQRCAGWFLESVRDAWRGDPKAGPPEYVDWFVDTSYLRRPEDEGLLREGLRLAGLPA